MITVLRAQQSNTMRIHDARALHHSGFQDQEDILMSRSDGPAPGCVCIAANELRTVCGMLDVLVLLVHVTGLLET